MAFTLTPASDIALKKRAAIPFVPVIPDPTTAIILQLVFISRS